MAALQDAFERAGMPTHAMAMAAACRDLAVIVLNETGGDTRRALGLWLDRARQPLFRDGPLIEFIAAIAAERNPAAGHDHIVSVTQAGAVDPAAGAEAGPDHKARVTQVQLVDPASSETAAAGTDQAAGVTHVDTVDPAAAAPRTNAKLMRPTREPSREERLAARNARREEVKSVFEIVERQGNRTPIEQVPIRRLPNLLRHFGRYALKAGYQYNLIFGLKERADQMAHIPIGAKIGDVFSSDEIRLQLQKARYVHSNAQFILPQRLLSLTQPEAGV